MRWLCSLCFLVSLAGYLTLPKSADAAVPASDPHFGWLPADDLGVDDPALPLLKQSGEGKHRFLWDFIPGGLTPRDQGNSPTCVGFATATAVDLTQHVAIFGIGVKPVPTYDADPNSVYALSRVEIARDTHGVRVVGDGSRVRWAAEAVSRFGLLKQHDYGSVDLSVFDPRLYRDWGNRGLPDALESAAKSHLVLDVFPVYTYEAIRDALFSGSPVVIGSSIGFEGQDRDQDGFLQPRGVWNHAMVFVGYTEEGRSGVCILNSWGDDWVGGPNRHGAPNGSFWVTPETVTLMLEEGEGWAFRRFTGFRGPIEWERLQ